MHVSQARSWFVGLGRRSALVLMMAGSVACGGGEAPAETADTAEPAAPPAAESPAGTTPRLVWMSPMEGTEVKSPVHVMFGAEHYEIAAVPQGTVETARPGIAHHHVGVDTECLPVGTEIPKADPWVHFGDGGSMMNMQLTAGKHTLTLQAGDDLHRTIEGLCETIAVTVVE